MSGERRSGFFVSGGTLSAGAASYIERSTDKTLLESLLDRKFCYVLNSRQLGKSSLSVHVISALKQHGVRTVFLDLTRLGSQNVSADQWYSGLAFELGREMGSLREAMSFWKEHAPFTFVQRFFELIRVLGRLDQNDSSPLVIFIDEIDATRSLSFDPDEFFAGIRECYNRRVVDPAFEKLTFCLIGVAVPTDLVRNRATTPFNIGERITLEDFTVGELKAFAPQLGPRGKDVISRIHYWTHGHPFLSQSLCGSIVRSGQTPTLATVDDAVRRELFDYKAKDANINLADVANIALHYGDKEANGDTLRANVLSLYERILTGKSVNDDESNRAVVLLKLSGLVRSDGRRLTIRNRIYRKVFDKTWIEEHLPEQELRRQRQSFRRGALRTSLVTGALLVVFGAIASFAWISRQAALKTQLQLDYEAYVADMNSLGRFYETGNTGRIEEILNRRKNSPYRGFEWGYWLGRYHDSPEEYTLDYAAPGKRVEGHLSSDGREVCIVDTLSRTATIVDRQAKKPIKTTRIADPHGVIPLRSRWVEMRISGSGLAVHDLKSDRTLCVLGDPGMDVKHSVYADHSDFVLTAEGPPPGLEITHLNLWNAATGLKAYSLPNPAQSPTDRLGYLYNFSVDGRFLMYTHGPSGSLNAVPNQVPKGEGIVVELASKKVLDRFPTTLLDENGTAGFDGNALLIVNRGQATIRDIRNHRFIPWRPQAPNDWQVSTGSFSGDTLTLLLEGGQCVVRDLTGKTLDVLRENVSSIAPGATDGQTIASSSSVRIYDSRSGSDATAVASGSRITRYGPGVLNLFGNPTGMQRVRESDFHVVGSLPPADGGAYTYTGRWLLKNSDLLVSAEGVTPPIHLPFAPAIWSCGKSADSIVLWQPRTRRLTAYSGITHNVRWSRNDVGGMNSLWVSPDGSRLFVTPDGRNMAVYDMQNGRLKANLEPHNLGPVNLVFSADGHRAFTCGGDGSMLMWDTHTLKKQMEFRGNDQEAINGADISPDGRRVATASRSGSWQLWDAATGVQLLDVHVSASPVTSVLFGAPGDKIFTASDGQVRVWRSLADDPTIKVPIDHSFLRGLRR